MFFYSINNRFNINHTNIITENVQSGTEAEIIIKFEQPVLFMANLK